MVQSMFGLCLINVLLDVLPMIIISSSNYRPLQTHLKIYLEVQCAGYIEDDVIIATCVASFIMGLALKRFSELSTLFGQQAPVQASES